MLKQGDGNMGGVLDRLILVISSISKRKLLRRSKAWHMTVYVSSDSDHSAL